MSEKRIKVLMAKPGLDAHWRGMIVVSNALRDAGFEVIYGGNMQPLEIATAAVQEDVDVVGLSILSANYLPLTAKTITALKKQGKGETIVLLGGIVHDRDFPTLNEMGVTGIFTPGTPMADIVDFVRNKTTTAA